MLMMKVAVVTTLVILFAMVSPVWSANSVTVKGLFKGTAILLVDGQQVVLREGQTKQGVKLIKATSKDALLVINGKQQRVGLSKQVGGSYQAPTTKVVRIASQDGGHHWVRGQVNGRSVDFVVDTGASLIALNLSTAKRLGINYEKGEAGWTSTANGYKEIRLVNLEKVTIGEITHYNVQASVGLDDSLPVALLGNSFLSRNNIKIEDGVLIMEAK